MSDQAWRSIESAPKDGTDVFVYVDANTLIGVASYNTYANQRGGWWSFNFEYWASEIYPTLWMPIPPLPDPPLVGGQK